MDGCSDVLLLRSEKNFYSYFLKIACQNINLCLKQEILSLNAGRVTSLDYVRWPVLIGPHVLL